MKMFSLKAIPPHWLLQTMVFSTLESHPTQRTPSCAFAIPVIPTLEASPPEGDTKQQELLARLKAQKILLTDYLDKRSAYLTQFAEEANAAFDKIGEDALKGLDEPGARIVANIGRQMQAFEESAELNRIEIEKNDTKVADVEGQMRKGRNEGMFFKILGVPGIHPIPSSLHLISKKL